MSRVRIRHGENEIEVEGSDKFIQKHLASFYKKVEAIPAPTSAAKLKQEIMQITSAKARSGIAPAPAEFFKSKNKTDGISQILIFGKYLEEYRSVSEFTRSDINKLAEEAKLPKAIHAQYFTNAVKQGLLRGHDRGKYSLTLSAESVITSM